MSLVKTTSLASPFFVLPEKTQFLKEVPPVVALFWRKPPAFFEVLSAMVQLVNFGAVPLTTQMQPTEPSPPVPVLAFAAKRQLVT